jgi:hypothetical protein
MKKNVYLIALGLVTIVSSCTEPAPPPPPPVPAPVNQMNNLMQQGFNEATKQLADSNSVLNTALDTLGEVIGDNKEVIGDKVNEGLNALKKLN